MTPRGRGDLDEGRARGLPRSDRPPLVPIAVPCASLPIFVMRKAVVVLKEGLPLRRPGYGTMPAQQLVKPVCPSPDHSDASYRRRRGRF